MSDHQLGLFDEPYPSSPGWKARSTSRDAAAGIAAKAGPLRDRVLAEVRRRPGTPEQISDRIREPLMNVRPRLSELAAKGLVEDSGKRGDAAGGRKAIIWRPTVEPVEAAA